MDELLGLEWRDLDWHDRILTIRAEVAKTGRRRFIKIEQNAIDWLRAYQERGGRTEGRIVRYNARVLLDHRRANQKAAGVTHWPNSGMRNSYASYHLGRFKNINDLCLALGHRSPTMLWEHYHKSSTERESNAFWEIRPATSAENVVAFQAGP